ncbi:sodium-coupled monocarboxylate transporter 1-like [Mya arenaria]|uniref:sodium-coupled monocarboxylate transporter 1-like n=1 Tax=Mya arenaria TaxID=6604 RepID=UPI0022DEA0DF|nr:sodium-coupled monocarboxylate transporter 1-like [Mya arenaria]
MYSVDKMEDYSIYNGHKKLFHIVDYIIFALVLLVSLVIGIYHAYKDRHNTNAEEFHQSGRKMHPVPVSLSLCATFMSALTLLGNPAEIYTHGTMFYWIVLAMLLSTICSAHVFVPIFYKLKTISCFTYIQLRFGKVVRVIASVLYISQMLLYMGFVLYAPSLALEAVTGMTLWGTMISVGAVCVLYTSLGGMKTVLWTDSFQLVIMFAGTICVLIFGSIAVGGFSSAWNIANERDRIEFWNVSVDPRTRHTVWSVGIGGAMFWTYLYGVNQAQVQRACSLPTLKKAKLALWLNFPLLICIITLTCMLGIVSYAFYKDCDPKTFGLITKGDQLLPLLVLDVLGNYPGLPGLFIASIFSGSLSSISSGLNAMSAIIIKDFLKPLCWKTLQGRTELIVAKTVVVLCGILQFFVALAIAQASGLIIQLSYTLFSIVSGPLLGLFLGGMIFPCINKIGATCGLVMSLLFIGWLGISATIVSPTPMRPALPILTIDCNWNITTTENQAEVNLTSTNQNVSEPPIFDFYRISYQWYTMFGMLTNICVSLLVTVLTGVTENSERDSKLFYPLFYNLAPFLPKKYRNRLMFGVQYQTNSKDEECELRVSGNNGEITTVSLPKREKDRRTSFL